MNISGRIITLSANETMTTSAIAAALNEQTIDLKTINCQAGGCTLIFDGPKLNGCDIFGEGTTLVFQKVAHTFANHEEEVATGLVITPYSIRGTFYCECLYPELFGAVGNGVTDDTSALQKCLDLAVDMGIYRVRLQPRTYLITDTLYYRANIQIEGSHLWNYYHETYGSRILADFTNVVTEHAAGDGKTAKYPQSLKFALDSDCYKRDFDENDNSYFSTNIRFLESELFSSSSNLFFCQRGDTSTHLPKKLEGLDSQNYSYTYAGPIHIKNVYIESTKEIDSVHNTYKFAFGAIRCIGMTNAHIEGVVIKGFMVGLMLSKGWAFKVERTQIIVGKWGMVLGGEITEGYFDAVQIACKEDFDVLKKKENINGKEIYIDSEFSYDASQSLYPSNPPSPKNPYRTFFDTFVFSIAEFDSIYGETIVLPKLDNNNEPISDQTISVCISDKIYSVALIAHSASATLNSCTMESFDMGCIGTRTKLTFETPYVEYINDTIAYIRMGSILFNNMLGFQGLTSRYTYVVPYDDAVIVLNHCHPGTFYPTYYVRLNGNQEAYNRKFYNHRSYVVQNHDKRESPLPYSDTNYLDYDVGDTVYVRQQYALDDFEDIIINNQIIKTKEQQLEEAISSLSTSWGNYYQHPIYLELALQRIANDLNYRHVIRIVLVRDYEVNESLTWSCPNGRLTLERSNSIYSLKINARQNFECDIVFKNFAVDLYSSLCFARNKQMLEIRIENSQIRFHRNDIYVIDNHIAEGETLPQGKSLCRMITLYAGSKPNVRKYYINDWPALSTITVERSGVSLGAGSYNGLPNQFLYDDYEFTETTVDPATNLPITNYYKWDEGANTWILQNT